MCKLYIKIFLYTLAISSLGISSLGISNSAFAQKTYKIATIPSLTSMFPNVQERVQLAFDSLGKDVVFIELPELRASIYSDYGKYDGELIRESNYDYYVQNMVKVPVVLAHTRIAVMARADSDIHLLSELEGKKLGVLAGAPILQGKAMNMDSSVFEFLNFNQAAKMVSRRRLDAALIPEQLIDKVMSENTNLKILDETFIEIDFNFWLHSKNEDLLSSLTEALSQQ